MSKDPLPCPQVSDEAHDSSGPSGGDSSCVCRGVQRMQGARTIHVAQQRHYGGSWCCDKGHHVTTRSCDYQIINYCGVYSAVSSSLIECNRLP